MIDSDERILKKGIFEQVEYSSSGKYSCNQWKLTLTQKHLQVDCRGSWSKTFENKEIGIELHDKTLEIYDFWYHRLLFRIVVNKADEWCKAYQDMVSEQHERWRSRWEERLEKAPNEWERLFDIDLPILRNVYDEIQEEQTKFRRKNILFNLDILKAARALNQRKLKAFIIAHNYVAWYEWTKRILGKIFKAKFGKGPSNDEQLLKFLEGYPSLGILNTKEWEIKANQIRNCVAHEKFYFDYTSSRLVFVVKNKEKRIRLRELELRCAQLSNTYWKLFEYLTEKITEGEISTPLPFT